MDAGDRWAVRLGQIGLGVAMLFLLLFCIVAPRAGGPGHGPVGGVPGPYTAETGGLMLPVDVPPILYLILPPGFLISLALAVMLWLARPSQAG
jgi:hypothetical protein